MKYLQVEVKICEGCGALWLRRGVGDGVYCMHCTLSLAVYPAPCGKRPGGRPVTAKPRQARLKGCSCSAGSHSARRSTAGAR
jgi:hypothetical protein